MLPPARRWVGLIRAETKTLANDVNSFLAIYEAYRKCLRGKRENVTALKFRPNAVSRCKDLAERLQNGTYEVGPYFDFEVFEPKQRLVQAINFEGKIVQHSLCDNALYPAMERMVIDGNVACQVGKGTLYGLDKLTSAMRHYFFSRKAADEERRRAFGLPRRPKQEWDYSDGWVLKGDFHHFFYTLRHDVCHEVSKDALERAFDSEFAEYVTDLLDLFIDSTPDPGIPIGNQSSQIMALLYINWMDHWLTDGLAMLYGRYMDDFWIIDENKGYLKQILREIEERSAEIGLSLNPKTQIFPLRHGLDYLGFHTYLTETGKVVRKVRHKSVTKMRRRIGKYRHLVNEGRMTLESVWQSYSAWRGHCAHGDCHRLIFRMDELFLMTFPELEERLNVAKAK